MREQTAGDRKTFLSGRSPVSFGFPKEMGLYLYKSGTVKSVPYSKNGRIVSAPTFLSAAFGVKNRMFAKNVDKKNSNTSLRNAAVSVGFYFFL
ncbi:MAG: hypothetical protein J6J15_00710 [Oscillospiraceae bacterium]|nr:hypothetical protein [Oscillospiraceae bacterium]